MFYKLLILSFRFAFFCKVIEGLLKKNEAGIVPHYTLPHTLGSLASINTYGIVPYLKMILSFMIPLLGGIKTDITRQAFAYGKQNDLIVLSLKTR